MLHETQACVGWEQDLVQGPELIEERLGVDDEPGTPHRAHRPLEVKVVEVLVDRDQDREGEVARSGIERSAAASWVPARSAKGYGAAPGGPEEPVLGLRGRRTRPVRRPPTAGRGTRRAVKRIALTTGP